MCEHASGYDSILLCRIAIVCCVVYCLYLIVLGCVDSIRFVGLTWLSLAGMGWDGLGLTRPGLTWDTCDYVIPDWVCGARITR